MVMDQAEQLRFLVHAAPEMAAERRGEGGARQVVVTGSRPGVGATTVAVNVGAALADRGARVLLVDAADERTNMLEVAGVRPSGQFTLSDAMAKKCDVADAVITGPAGLKLLAAGGRAAARRDRTAGKNAARGHKEPLSTLRPLLGSFDVMILETGAGLTRTARRLWLRAPLVLLVTTRDDAAVTGAYAAIKGHVTGADDASCENVRLLVNRAPSERVASETQRRVSECCQRFLRRRVAALPAIPVHEDSDEALAGPRAWETPNSGFGHAVLWLGRAVEDVLRIEDTGCRMQRLGVSALPVSCIPHPASC